MVLSQCLLELFDPGFKKKHSKSSFQKGDPKEFNRNYSFFSSTPLQAFLPPALITVAHQPLYSFSLRLHKYSKLNSRNPTLMRAFCSHFKMHYIRGRILIWNYRSEHTVGLKLDLSLKLSNRTVDRNTDTAESHIPVTVLQCLFCKGVRKRRAEARRLEAPEELCLSREEMPTLEKVSFNLFLGIMSIWKSG